MKDAQKTRVVGRDAAAVVGKPGLVAGGSDARCSGLSAGGSSAGGISAGGISHGSTGNGTSHPGTKPTQSWVRYVDSRLKQFGTR